MYPSGGVGYKPGEEGYSKPKNRSDHPPKSPFKGGAHRAGDEKRRNEFFCTYRFTVPLWRGRL